MGLAGGGEGVRPRHRAEPELRHRTALVLGIPGHDGPVGGSAGRDPARPGARPALAHLQKTLEMRPDFAPTHFYLGQAYELAGRYDEAIAEKAYDARSGSLVWIDTSDQWKELRSDPRFQDL